MKLESLNFSTPDAACHSLHVLAELARRGEIQVNGNCRVEGIIPSEVLRLAATQPAERKPACRS